MLAIGALSYITKATLSKVSEHWERASTVAPVFLFFPLVATNVDGVVAFFESKDLEIFYDPAAYWIPQRIFADVNEADAIQAAENKVLANAAAQRGDAESTAVRPSGAKAGCVHATPLFAAPRGFDLANLSRLWLRKAEKGRLDASASAQF